ncbi:MAG: glycine cleavage T C-terminal barrel domain-containing protein [Gammaproteobacteria bacterium]
MEHIEPAESDYNAAQPQSSTDPRLVVVDDGYSDHSDRLLVNGQRRVPINLLQSGDSTARMAFSTRIRKSPYWHLSQRHGCYAYEVYNHMYHPRGYVKPEDGGLLKEYEYLTKDVTLWNVAVERQIQIKGPDALAFANLLVTRDLTDKCKVNQARYVILCNERGGIINDPVLLRVAEDEIWLSISDSDVLLWAQGINYKAGYEVEISELDVAPLQIQGPKSKDLMHKLLGDAVLDIPYYGLWPTRLRGMDIIVSRTGFSAEVGYEIYLRAATSNADRLWETLIEAGEEFNLQVIAPSHIRRLEAGILSYGQDMDIETNPFEVGLNWQVDLAKPDFIGKQALLAIANQGVSRRLAGLLFGGDPITWYLPDFLPVLGAAGEQEIGFVTSAWYSPKLGCNIALAMLLLPHDEAGAVRVLRETGAAPVESRVCKFPFFDAAKKLPKS